MSEARLIDVVLYSHAGEWDFCIPPRMNSPPENLIEFIEWAKVKLEQIPAEYRGTAKIVAEVDSSYDNHYPLITITYQRPETDEERVFREEEERRRKEEKRFRELALLEELKRKYETPGQSG